MRFRVAAAGDVRSQRPTGLDAKSGWFCLDDHLWIAKPPVLEAAMMLPFVSNAEKSGQTDVAFKLKTMTLQPSGVSAAAWAKVPEAQALIDGVARHIDRHLARAIPSARGPLPDAAPPLWDMSLPRLVWADPPIGRVSRAIHALKRRLIWPGVATYQAEMRKKNRDRNSILKPFDAPDELMEAAVALPEVPLPDQKLARFVQRLKGLVQPMDMEVVLTWAPDFTSVDLGIEQAGRIDLLTGASVFERTQSGFDVLRLEGAERDAAINAYVLTRLVVLARSFEASWIGLMPRLKVQLTLAGLPEVRGAQLAVDARGWDFGLTELVVGLPTTPARFPDGIALRFDPVKLGTPQPVPPLVTDVPLIGAKPVAAGLWVAAPVTAAPLAQPAPDVAQGWIAPGQNARVQGRYVGDMIYVGTQPFDGLHHEQTRAFVDPSLKLTPPVQPPQLPYWPSYSTLSPQDRWSYLDWLSGPRDSGDVGFMFLYFYGLEGRFFQDTPSRAERLILLAEVQRLLEAFGEHYSAKQYLGNFLDCAGAVLYPEGQTEPSFERRGYDMSLELKLALGRKASAEEPLSADWMLSWLMHHPTLNFHSRAQRAFPEFRLLFGVLFHDAHPQGLKMRKPRKMLAPEYRAAAGDYVTDLRGDLGDVPDVTNSEKPINLAAGLAEQALQMLARFNRLLGRDPEARDTLAGQLALPRRLLAAFPNAKAADLQIWADGIVASGGLVSLTSVMARLGQGGDTGKREQIEASDALAVLGFGMAPDPRFGIRRAKADEPVVVFALPESAPQLEQVGAAFAAVQAALAVGSLIAHADGGVLEVERIAVLNKIFDTPDLTALELVHLAAMLQWFLAVPPDLGLLARRMKDTPVSAKQDLAQLALAVAASDGMLDPREIAALEKLYSALGLDSAGIYAALNALVTVDRPVLVRVAHPEAGHAIPPRPAHGPSLTLDRDRIAAVMLDTAQVAHFLNTQLDNDAPDEDIAEAAPPSGHGFEGLDAAHIALLAELMVRETWNEVDFAALAAQHRLMPSGALEAINEWSFDRFGDMMIEDYDGYTLNRDFVTQLQNGL